MAYVCKVCGFVLEEDELPEDYVCPVCGVPCLLYTSPSPRDRG